MNSYYLIIGIAVLISFAIGLFVGMIRSDKPIGTLILNESDKSKEYFEFHFEEDIDAFKDEGRISFRVLKK